MKAGCVNGIRFNEKENKVLPPWVEPETRFELKTGDVLVSRANTRELLGSAALVRGVRPRLLLCDKLYRLYCRPSLNAQFLVYFLRSSQARFQIEREATGTSGSMQNVGQDTLQNLVLALPPEPEQVEICRRIEARTLAIDDSCARVESAIYLLREYRAALISAAVNGQIDVRKHEKRLEALA
jgi:type I restriction enzyme S subunit